MRTTKKSWALPRDFPHSSHDVVNMVMGPTIMRNGKSASVMRQLGTIFTEGTATGLSDSQLLERFASKRAESAEAAQAAEMAFEALVSRHGVMVWGVCRRVLGNAHEAEDAFQATFLLLVRKAESLQLDGSLGRWLYGVAHRIALRARFQARRRAASHPLAPATTADDPAGAAEQHDLREILGAELERLPLKYRCPIELCYLQGMTYEQAARQLDWPVATVKSRLTRGRLRLRHRLARRGLAPLAAGIATALCESSRAAVPPALVHSIVHSSVSRAAGVVPAPVTELAERALRMMMWEKLKLAAAGIVVAVGVGVAATALAQRPEQDRSPPSRPAAAEVQAAAPPAVHPPHDPRWMRTLSSGATIEVLGVSPHPSGPATWWRPDGTPLLEPPCDPFRARIGAGGDVVVRAVVVRVTHLPPGADDKWSVKEGNGGSGGRAESGGKPVFGLSEAVTVFPRTLKFCTVRFEVASGVWTTVQTWGKSPGALGSAAASYIFSAPIATQKGTTLSVTHNLHDVSVRLVAVDRDGKEHSSDFRSGAGVKDFVQTTVEFPLPPEQIKEFRVQTRPYEVVEIPGVALEGVGRQ
ncbi:MAG: RNA polymerase sigma factor [Isosphaeraceae bacterium]